MVPRDGRVPWYASVCLGLALTLLSASWVVPTARPPAAAVHSTFASSAFPLGSRPELSIDPSAASLAFGQAVVLEARWGEPPEGCSAEAPWSAWGANESPPVGTLNSSRGPSVGFTANSNRTGVALVSVRSFVEIDCGGRETSAWATATSRIVVVAPLTIDGLTTSPGPICPGTTVRVAGSVAGGSPPFRVVVSWGDGTAGGATVAANGTFAATHPYADGTFAPSVRAYDSSGQVAVSAPPNPIRAGWGPALGLVTTSEDGVVGTPFEVELTYRNLSGPATVVVECEAGMPVPLVFWSPPSGFSCRYTTPGPVTLTVSLDGPGLPALQALLNATIEPALAISAMPSTIDSETGLAEYAEVNLSGGAPPFSLVVAGIGTVGSVVRPIWSDGSVGFTLNSSRPGVFPLQIDALDAAGEAVATSSIWRVAPALRLNVSAATSSGVNSTETTLTGDSEGGVGTVFWGVLAQDPSQEGSGLAGGLSDPGRFGTSLEFDEEGETSVSILAVDSAGAVALEELSVPLVPRLGFLAAVTAGPTNGTGVALGLVLNITGGLAPFSIGFEVLGGATWNLSASADGDTAWTLSAPLPGPTDWWVRCTDALGYSGFASGRLAPSPDSNSSSPPTPPPSPVVPSPGPGGATAGSIGVPAETAGVLGVLALASGAVLLVLRRRRARRRSEAGPPRLDPEGVLRQLIEPADGADRATIELLAEEEGIPLPRVRATIDRLVSAGTILSETSPEGEESLTWIDPEDR